MEVSRCRTHSRRGVNRQSAGPGSVAEGLRDTISSLGFKSLGIKLRNEPPLSLFPKDLVRVTGDDDVSVHFENDITQRFKAVDGGGW